MHCSEFARSYCPDVTIAENYRIQSPQQAQLDEYSIMFGKVLHGVLITQKQQQRPDGIDSYIMNGDKILSSAIAAEADANDEPSAELFRQKAHHAMNWLMLPAWNTLGEQPVPPNSNQGIQRRHDLTNAQHGIAVLAGLFYHLREQHVLEDPDYINPEKACSQRNAIEGVMHELDTAYLGLRFAITHPGVSIVPGPIQFEKNAGSSNSDFVVVDIKRHLATGLQVKARTRQEHLQKYDDLMVQLIDGAIDLSGERRLRCIRASGSTTPHGRQHSNAHLGEMIVSWGGIHSTHHLVHKTTQRNCDLLRSGFFINRKFMQIQFAVKNSLGQFEPNPDDYKHLSYKIETGLIKGSRPNPSSIPRTDKGLQSLKNKKRK